MRKPARRSRRLSLDGNGFRRVTGGPASQRAAAACRISNHVDGHIDIDACGLGIGAKLLGILDELLRYITPDTRQADIEAGTEGVIVAAGEMQMYLGIDGNFNGIDAKFNNQRILLWGIALGVIAQIINTWILHK